VYEPQSCQKYLAIQDCSNYIRTLSFFTNVSFLFEFSYCVLYTTAGYNMTQDACCFPEANSTEITCNVTIYLPPSMVEEGRVTLELDATDHNLVCSQSQLNVTIKNTGAGAY